MTVFLTILAGVITFVIGQIVIKLLVDPVHQLKLEIAEISHALIMYANIYANPNTATKEKEIEVSDILRALSSNLNGKAYLVPFYGYVQKSFGLPEKENIYTAAKSLIGLSNGVFSKSDNASIHNAHLRQKVCDLLNIYMPKEERISEDILKGSQNSIVSSK